MKYVQIGIAVIATVVCVYVWAFFGLASVSLPWIVAIMACTTIGAVCLKLWYFNTAQRATFISLVKKRWYLWVPASVAALVSTIAVAVVAASGYVIPVLNWGAPGTPWLYLYLLLFGCWTEVMLLGVCFFHQPTARKVAALSGDFVRRGGCWKIWSEDNFPANSLLVVWLAVVVVAISYGPPTPAIRIDAVETQAQGYLDSALKNESVQELVGSQDDSILNFLSQTFVGTKLITAKDEKAKTVSSDKLYVRGWKYIWLTILLLPFVMFGMIFSRRDEFARRFERLSDFLRRKKEELKASASSAATVVTEAATAATGAGASAAPQMAHDTPFAKLLASDLISDTLVASTAWLSKLLKR